jgi:hypothetical protein
MIFVPVVIKAVHHTMARARFKTLTAQKTQISG